MTPLVFGPAGRPMFGLHHPAAVRLAPATAVLLCNPFGQEAVRTHRLFKVLAERLARAGMDVLRFDYHGTGESPGDDTAGDLAGWVADIGTAHEELLRRCSPEQVVWVGVRLGATLAALACGSVRRAPDRVVLWEPLAHGADYLELLARKHVEALEDNFGQPQPEARAWLATHRLDELDEAIGFGLSPRLRQQLMRLEPASFSGVSGLRWTVIAEPGNRGAGELAERFRSAGQPVEWLDFAHSFEWTSEEALNTALVPAEALQLLARHIGA
ncbi:alpha/beta hydrolase [Aquabacterium sp. A7-Y]|uniref:serine aminopeptidase domain-containing protein n=1 Tax=Aquabacterium sp. A7-Y TaxID=1349605 RepID=UPI00223E85BA|nr:alpha/beta hydrolase [Aquabacterium sp. A7-Y]MCW7537503.1 alpha/beta hydrolase [Aquabacterium sp. A7-Y]